MNHLLTRLYYPETEICSRKHDDKIKKQRDIDRHGPKPSSNKLPTSRHPFLFITNYLKSWTTLIAYEDTKYFIIILKNVLYVKVLVYMYTLEFQQAE